MSVCVCVCVCGKKGAGTRWWFQQTTCLCLPKYQTDLVPQLTVPLLVPSALQPCSRYARTLRPPLQFALPCMRTCPRTIMLFLFNHLCQFLIPFFIPFLFSCLTFFFSLMFFFFFVLLLALVLSSSFICVAAQQVCDWCNRDRLPTRTRARVPAR